MRTYLLICLFCAWSALAAEPSDLAKAAPERLSRYIQIDTVNPPGNEIAAARFLAQILEEAGIPYEISESAPGRANLWATLKGGRQPALVLLHHMDVVPADARFWDVDPRSGIIQDGYVWGRGALDMKGLGIVQLQAFLALHAQAQKLNRDVLFVATADEEAGGSFGAGWLVENRGELFKNAGFLLNEGGGGSIVGDETVFYVELTQKVPVWLKVVSQGNPGHGSAPQTETAVTRLLRAGQRLAETEFSAHVIPAVAAMFKGIAPFQSEALKPRYEAIEQAVQDPEFMALLKLTNPRHHALLRNTCSITRLSGSDKINVVPAEATLEMDCRVLPDQNVDEFVSEIATIINDPSIRIEKLMAFTPAVTSADTPLYKLISAVTATRHPGSRVISSMTSGFTDSHFFRDLGISSYGFSPVVVAAEDGRGVHGNNERINVEALIEGTQTMIDLLKTFTGT